MKQKWNLILLFFQQNISHDLWFSLKSDNFEILPQNYSFFLETRQLIDNNLIIKPTNISENEYTFWENCKGNRKLQL